MSDLAPKSDLAPTSELAIAIRGVEKRYEHFRLDGIDLTLHRGQVMGFIGPNGAGKSTTIRILMGLVRQDAGEVTVLGRRMPDEQVVAKREIGFASEDMRLYNHATLAWHMRFIQSIYPAWDADYAQRLLRRFDLVAEQKIKGLSHGQRVKAGLLLVLARRPPLLILDEPTTGLDPVARKEVLSELSDVLRDESRTILFSSHNTQDVEQLSDQITFIDRGSIIDARDKETFLESWRRIHLELPADVKLPVLPAIVAAEGTGRIVTVTTDCFGPDLVHTVQQAGATVRDIQPMTLEEIFISRVAVDREKEAA